MEITREIENISQYFVGEPEQDWELQGIKQNTRYFVYYYKDRQGSWHHKTVKRNARYNPFETQVREENGAFYAKVVNKKTGKPVKA